MNRKGRKIHIISDKDGRVETGMLQIDDDWPGLFIRGDDCMQLKFLIEDYLLVHKIAEIEGRITFNSIFAESLLDEVKKVVGYE